MALERIGFIGLGSQGAPMAERIVAAGHSLTVWARRAEVLEPFLAAGASAAASVAQLGAQCDLVGICVVDDAGVAAICRQLIPAMRPGSLIAIHSTILPESAVALAAQCTERGIALIDAPVSGGAPAAAAGALTVMCGGSAAAFEAAKPVFECFGKLIVRVGGDVGAGQRAKLVNNALMAANMGLAHAALGAATALGIEREALVELIKQSSGRSFGFEVYARLPAPAAFSHGAALLVKDVNLLKRVLPEEQGAETLRAAASNFLAAATGG